MPVYVHGDLKKLSKKRKKNEQLVMFVNIKKIERIFFYLPVSRLETLKNRLKKEEKRTVQLVMFVDIKKN